MASPAVQISRLLPVKLTVFLVFVDLEANAAPYLGISE
jgi:hypothetical protein